MSLPLQSQVPANNISGDGLKTWSCIICRRRKVKCDRRDPCSNCTRAGIDCHFPVTGRLPRRRQNPATVKTQAQKQTELLSRLRRLETVVTELAGQVEDGPREPQIAPATAAHCAAGSTPGSDTAHSDSRSADPSVRSSGSELQTQVPVPGSEFDEEFGRLVVDKDGGLHIGNRFWTVFCNEVDHIFDAMHDMTDESAHLEPSTSSIPSGPQDFVFCSAPSSNNIDALFPLPSQMLFIWQTYVDNVDPFLKVLHIPSVDKVMRDLKGNFSSLAPNMKALLFSISLAAINSMEEPSVVMNFNVPKAQLIAKYRFGAEQALGQASFLTTRDITVVQAFVIYLTILFSLGANDVAWPLVGLLLRIGKTLNLHLKEAERDHNRLEIEIRRRIWWQMCFIDSISQKPGVQDLSISETSFNIDPPSGIDDADLDAATPGPATVEKTSTRMVPSLIRIQVWRLVQTLQANTNSPSETKLQIYYAAKSKVATEILSHLQPDAPFDNYIKTMISLFFAKAELVLHRPSHSHPTTPESIQSALRASIVIINAIHALLTKPTWANWRWQLSGHIPWHAIGIFLRQACRQPWGPESEQMWASTKRLIDSAPPDAKENRLWKPLVELMRQAENHRASQMAGLVSGAPREQLPAVNHDPKQMATNVLHDAPVAMPYPANGLHQTISEEQPSSREGVLGLQDLNIAGAAPLADVPMNFAPSSQGGLHSKSADPTWWSPTTQLEGLCQGETSGSTALPGEDLLMVLDSWDEAAAFESLWDIL